MEIFIDDPNSILDPTTGQLAERRLRFSLSRYSSRIESMELAITLGKAQRGRSHVGCRMKIQLRPKDVVTVDYDDTDMTRCINRLAERAERAVRRKVESAQDLGGAIPKPI